MEECVREATGFGGYPAYEWPENGGFAHLYYGYKYVIATAVQFLRKMEWMWTANVFGALFWEPKEAVSAGAAIEQGKVDTFQDYRMNPKVLSDEQKKKTPVLALHGKNGSQGMFLKMGRYFWQNNMGPFFTVNLKDGELCEEDLEIVNGKIEEIISLYGREVKIDIVGYSRGAELALYTALLKESWRIEEGGQCFLRPAASWRKEVGKVIRIGSMTLAGEWDKLSDAMKGNIYEIRGKDDIHMPEPSLALHKYEIDGVGHVGLVGSPLVFKHLKTILS